MRAFHVIGRKIIGVHANYPCRIRELGGAAHLLAEPTFFLKPTSAYVIEPDPIRIPADVSVEHEGISVPHDCIRV